MCPGVEYALRRPLRAIGCAVLSGAACAVGQFLFIVGANYVIG